LSADLEPYLTVGEVSGLCRLSKKTIYNLVRQGRMPRPVPLSTRRLLWTRASITEWLDQGCGPLSDLLRRAAAIAPEGSPVKAWIEGLLGQAAAEAAASQAAAAAEVR
jgi:excisionase family DNA binding protein